MRYTYDPAMPGNLKRIESSDGRVLTLTYETAGPKNRIKTINDGSRTWTYDYDSNDLVSVTLPDGSAWQFGSSAGANLALSFGPVSCDNPNPIDTTPYSWTMTHPAGAVGQFTLRGTVHGRSDVPRACDAGTRWTPSIPRYYYTKALVAKTISGPGIGALTWSYDYGPVNASWAPCDSSCVHSKRVKVTDPAGRITSYTFGTRFNVSDGRLEELNEDGVRITETRYRPFGAGPYPDFVGDDDGVASAGDGGIHLRLAPVDRKEITQQGATFTWEAAPASFDAFGRAQLATRFSSLSPWMTRIEKTEFADNLSKWVLGQVSSVTDIASGKILVNNEYYPATATLRSVREFGKLQRTLTYYPDGTIKTIADERNQSTEFSDYKRGIPQKITFADKSVQRATVDNIGKITSFTSEAGKTHSFTYDAIGRLKSIRYPSDAVGWNDTSVAFAPVATAEYDLAAGHWKEIVQTGNAFEVTYFDGLWRPVYVERYDSGDRANTSRIVKSEYDFAGHRTFLSYPQRSYQNIAGGVRTTYDVLGRVNLRSAHSELGPLDEHFSYEAGFRKRYTDAKGNTTGYSFQAFDQPTEEAVVSIQMPEGIFVDIERDSFGKTRSITRGDKAVAVTRRFVYDSFERLCKTIEPEAGATVQEYDLANNVQWRATGLSLPSAATCDRASVLSAKKANFSYDGRNRVKQITFGDNSPKITRTYTPDGLPETISSGPTWTYTYNNRRLLERERLAYGSDTFDILRRYDKNGSLEQLTYPADSLKVGYSPNALGEPRQVGDYATAIRYHPNGPIASFTYGNGVRHTMSQNIRGLPSQVAETNVLDESYTYENNSNVSSITDLLQGVATRGMTYDGLNRLKTVTAPALWGTAEYGYDAADNLVSTAIKGGQNARNTTHDIDYATNQLRVLKGPANFSFTYDYDLQGNTTRRGTQIYQFDLANRMKAADGRATYVYDGLGRRVSVVGNDGINRVQVYSLAGQLLYSGWRGNGTKYIYLHEHQIAEVK